VFDIRHSEKYKISELRIVAQPARAEAILTLACGWELGRIRIAALRLHLLEKQDLGHERPKGQDLSL